MDPLLIRVDAGAETGSGHVMRCLSLAQAWQDDGGKVIFAMSRIMPKIQDRLKEERMEFVPVASDPGSTDDAEELLHLAEKIKPFGTVLDGYHFGGIYQKTLKEAGLRLLAFDDKSDLEWYYADLILNQNPYAQESFYQHKESSSRLLLGPKYILLRREFHGRELTERKVTDEANKILIALGGADQGHTIAKIIQSLEQSNAPDLEIIMVTGLVDPYSKSLSSLVRQSSLKIEVRSGVSDMTQLMEWADLAISSAGTISWELAYLGVPNLTVAIAKNQRPVAESLARLGVAVSLGWHEDLSADLILNQLIQLRSSRRLREQMSREGRRLIDGEGTSRVSMYLRDDPVRLRPVRESDCQRLWDWANDPEVRQVSFSQRQISWEEHVTWFKTKLNDPSTFIFIGVDREDVPIGQIRFEGGEDGRVISAVVDKKYRNRGYGSFLIERASKKILETDSSVKRVYAYIKEGNEVSAQAFINAGFKSTGKKTTGCEQVLHLVFEKKGEYERVH